MLVALLGLLGQYPETFRSLLDIVGQVGPRSAVETFEAPIRRVIERDSTAGALLGVGTVLAVWSASSYVGAFIRASNRIYEVEEGRPFWKLRPLQIGMTLATLVLVGVVAIALVMTGRLLEAVADAIEVGEAATTVFSIAKWPAAVLVVMLMFASLYWVAPNVRQPRFRWVTPGGVVAVLGWIVASIAFAFYVSNFGSYDKTYGALGGVVVFLLWLWISNLALLFGAELDAEVERGRELEAGLPAKHEIQLPPRQAAKG